MKLYGSTRSPFARKAAIVAHEAGLWPRLAFVPVEIPTSTPAPEWRAANPLIKLPTLTLTDGTAIFDSPVICEYLAAHGRSVGLYPANGAARWHALTRQGLADGLLDILLLWRAEMRRPEAARQQVLFVTWTQRREGALDRCERDAATASDALTIGDIAAGVLLDYLDFRFPDLNWRAGRPALTAWHERTAARPSFRATPFDVETWTAP